MTKLRTDDQQPWHPVEMPTGRQHLPEWLVGLHVDWCFGTAGEPRIKLKVNGNPHAWPDQCWSAEPNGLYLTQHPDGRALAHYHKGAVRSAAAWRVFKPDGRPFTYQWQVIDSTNAQHPHETPLEAARREGEDNLARVRTLAPSVFSGPHNMPKEPQLDYTKCYIEVRMLETTTASEGYGGSHFPLTMQDGSERILRGPWHGGPPMGYAAVTTVDEKQRTRRTRWDRGYRWHQMGGCFGLYISDDLLVRAIAHFQPHMRIACLPENYGNRIQPYLPQWGGLKRDVYELERQRAINHQPAGPFWRAYWDARGSYGGTLRTPTYGFQPDVTDMP